MFFWGSIRKRSEVTDNYSMRNLLFMILILASVLIALLLWSPSLSTGDHPSTAVTTAGVLR